MPHPHWMRAFLFFQKSRFNTVKGILLTAAKQSSMENSKHANKNGGIMSGIFVIFLLINAEQQVKTGKHTSYFVTNPKSSTYQKYR